MTPKEKRDRLLKNRPLIRPLRIYNNENNIKSYDRDIAILWTAHKKKAFKAIDENLSQERFASTMEQISNSTQLFMIEDTNSSFEKGSGPVCIVGVTSDSWRAEPQAEFFTWATVRNKLRVTVSFLQWIQYKKIGVCLIRALSDSKRLLDHCRNYGVLFYVGKVVGGDPQGDEHIYSIMGKLNPKRNKRDSEIRNVIS